MPIKYSQQPQPRPIVHHHIVLKPHHKKLLIGGSSVVVILLIALSVFTYLNFVRQELNFNILDNKITDLRTETQKNINDVSTSLLEARENLNSLSSDIGDINTEFARLKASAGEDFSGIIESSVKAVVTIRTDVGQGTGFLITDDGYIVTNAHVLSGGSYVRAITYNQEIVDADFIGYTSNMDIALLKIPGLNEKLELGNSDTISVGEKVIAIGNPLGLQFSVSQGIVSAVHRKGANGLNAYIQTDAALNPGNSGGPLIDKEGKVIGINNFKIGQSESLGFALESNYIKEAVNAIAQDVLGQTLI